MSILFGHATHLFGIKEDNNRKEYLYFKIRSWLRSKLDKNLPKEKFVQWKRRISKLNLGFSSPGNLYFSLNFDRSKTNLIISEPIVN